MVQQALVAHQCPLPLPSRLLDISSIKQLYSKIENGNAIFTSLASSILRHEGVLNKRLCKNFFEKNRMPVFLWRFEYGRRRLNSNNESHWLQVSAYKLLGYYSSNMDMQNICSTLTSYYIQSYLLKR